MLFSSQCTMQRFNRRRFFPRPGRPVPSVLEILKASGKENVPPEPFKKPVFQPKELSPLYFHTRELLDDNGHVNFYHPDGQQSDNYCYYKFLKEVLEGRGKNLPAPADKIVWFLATYYRDRTENGNKEEVLKYLASHGVMMPDPIILWEKAIKVKSLHSLHALLGPSLVPFVESLLVISKFGPPHLSHQTPTFKSHRWNSELDRWAPVVAGRPSGKPHESKNWPHRQSNISGPKPAVIKPEAQVPIFCLADKTWWTVPINYCIEVIMHHAKDCDGKDCNFCSL